MKFEDIYQFFQDPPPNYLNKELAVCYVLSVLIEGESYGTYLIQQLEHEYPTYRLSDTVLYSALKFLEEAGAITGYWKKIEERGRPRRMYQISSEWWDKAKEFAGFWQRYIDPQLSIRTELDLGNNQITDVSPLCSLTNLTSLFLWDNQITDVSPLSSLTNLTELSLGNNQITDVSSLSSLTNLRLLSLGNNQITDVSPLCSLTNLTSLVLNDNQITDVSPLCSLTNLTSLVLNDNQITDVSPLSSLTNLTWLSLTNNQITDVSPLSSLTNLTELKLENNPVAQPTCPVSPPNVCSF